MASLLRHLEQDVPASGIGLAAGAVVALRHDPFTLTRHTPGSPECRIRLAVEVHGLTLDPSLT